jgi:hypothetical protein
MVQRIECCQGAAHASGVACKHCGHDEAPAAPVAAKTAYPR